MLQHAIGKEFLSFSKTDQLHDYLRYEPDTGSFYWKISSSRSVSAGDRAGTIATDGTRRLILHGQRYREHCVAWLFMLGKWPSKIVKHRNGNRADNRWENLYEVQ